MSDPARLPLNGATLRLYFADVSAYEPCVREVRLTFHAETAWRDVPGRHGTGGHPFVNEWSAHDPADGHLLARHSPGEVAQMRENGWTESYDDALGALVAALKASYKALLERTRRRGALLRKFAAELSDRQ